KTVESTNRRAIGNAGKRRNNNKDAPRANAAEISTRATADTTTCTEGPLPNRLSDNPATMAAMPRAPATPKPGNTKISKISRITPAAINNTSSQPTSSTNQWPQKNAAKASTPIAPGTPKPGVRNSTT